MNAAAVKLEKIEEQVRKCTACRLCETRTQAVPGVGNATAQIMLVGEGPGKNEDLKGEPFVGAAGKFLDLMLSEVGWKRSDVFITNVVKCRPPQNRDPELDEVETCTSLYLFKQIALIKPLVIVPLGRHALGRFIPDVSISAVHGRALRRKGQVYFAMYHPAVALYNGSTRETLIKDFKRLPKLLDLIRKQKSEVDALIQEMAAPEESQR